MDPGPRAGSAGLPCAGPAVGLPIGRRSRVPARGRVRWLRSPLSRTMGLVELTESFSWEGRRIAWARAGSGPAVVFCHGTPFSSRVWAPYAEALADRFTVHLWDLPGYGRSSMDPEHRVAADVHAQAFKALLDHWGLDRPQVVAHDLGGLVVAARAPGRGCGVRLAVPGRRGGDPAQRLAVLRVRPGQPGAAPPAPGLHPRGDRPCLHRQRHVRRARSRRSRGARGPVDRPRGPARVLPADRRLRPRAPARERATAPGARPAGPGPVGCRGRLDPAGDRAPVRGAGPGRGPDRGAGGRPPDAVRRPVVALATALRAWLDPTA